MSKNYDVCIICMNYLKNDARSLNLAETLSKLGVNVVVVSIYDKSQTELHFDTFDIKVNFEERLLTKMKLFYRKIKSIKSELKAEYYLASELYSLPSAGLLSKSNGGKLIYESREIFSALGNLHNKPIKQFILTLLEKYMIKDVSDVIVSGKLDAEYLKTIFPKNINYHLILNVPFSKEIIRSKLFHEHYGIDDRKKILIYQGMLMKGRGIELAIQSMKFLDDFSLVIMGEGDEMREQFTKLSQENGVSEKVYFKTPVDYTELHQWTCSADIGLALFEPISLSYNLALPNKLFEYAMAGIPSISTNLPAIRDVNQEHNFSFLIDFPFTPEVLAEAVRKVSISQNYQSYQNAAIEASKIFNYQAQIPTIKKIFKIK